MKPNSSSPQVLRQLLSFDFPKLSLVKCDDGDRSSFLRRGGVSNKSDTEKTTSASPCVICTQCQDNEDQVIFIFSSEGHHRPLLTSLLGGGSGSDEDGWPLCPSCLSVVRRLMGLMDEVEDIKARIKAVVKLAEGSNFVDKRKGPNATSLITNTLPISTYHEDDDHPMDGQDVPIKDHGDDEDDDNTIDQPTACFKHETMIEDDGADDPHVEGPFSIPLVINTDADINGGHHDDEPTLSTGEPTQTVRALRSHSLDMQKEGRKAGACNVPLPPSNSDQATTFGNKTKLVGNLKRVRSRPLKDMVYSCPLCPNKTFKTSKSWKQHRKDVHHKRRSPPCYFCQKTFSCPKYLVRHLRTHTLERPYLCSDCGQDFSESTYLKQHECPKNPSLYPPKPRLQCHLCGKTFQDSSGLVRHTRRAHNSKKMDFQPSPRAKGYPCPECGKTFTHKSYLTSHLQGIHLLDPSKKQNCPICPTSFYSEHVILAHTHPDPQDPFKVLYVCSICRKTFSNRHNYQGHWTIMHSRGDERGLQCEHCGKTFLTARSIKFHSKSCSVSLEEQRTCPVKSCGQVFSNLYERLNHERVVHRGLFSIRCYFCSKTLRCPGGIERHLRTHTKERPFFCLKCGKDFPVAQSLQTHVARVCGEDEGKREEYRKKKREHQAAFRAKLMYPCDICDRRFGQKPQLVAHKQRQHFV